ncbi:Hypothetical protein SRAE_2000409600 [Strongyloides ratti]|uniref:Uncharacterized protein n=1 Tax=Strongyloides ratti TaxID=34506 RepID=A0A090LI72_STRRB|nr:Hypothetical protein SRAE_2000409600 [Strongyloides ratti]CEF69447.1 Hypothetical protein SRAE_2000409600 [Strongyloides ratti]
MNFNLLFVLAFLVISSSAFYYYNPYYTYSSYYPSSYNYRYSGYYPSYYGYTGASYYPYYGYYGFGSNQNKNDIKNAPAQEGYSESSLTNNRLNRL